MGYLDKSTKTVTAHFTKRGRELLADALSGNTTGDYIITKYALGDDEIDYSLYDESQPENLRGRVIENAPILESFVNEQEIMNSVIKRVTPPVALQSQISNIPDQIRLEGRGDIFILAPQTDNIDEIEEYESEEYEVIFMVSLLQESVGPLLLWCKYLLKNGYIFHEV